MRNKTAKLLLMGATLMATALNADSQVLNLSITTAPGNVVRVIGVAGSPGFSGAAATAWGAMGITLRISKAATSPAPPTGANTGAVATNITSASTGFAGATPRNATTGTLGLAAFDRTMFGQADDGFWYFQISESTPGGNQAINAGDSVVIYRFTVPSTWVCNSCMEIVTTQLAGAPISTIPFIDNASTGGNVISVIQAAAPLPVTLLSFSASKTTDGRVQLNWQTAMEQGSDYFDVERSADGRVFDRQVGRMQAAGQSNGPISYQSYDVSPRAGDNYYRLKMMNVAGKATYSAVRTVHFDDQMAGVVVYPTDNTDGIVHVSLPQDLKEAEVYLIDAVGRKLPVSVSSQAMGTERSLSIKGLSAGTYMIQVVSGNSSKNFRLIYHP